MINDSQDQNLINQIVAQKSDYDCQTSNEDAYEQVRPSGNPSNMRPQTVSVPPDTSRIESDHEAQISDEDSESEKGYKGLQKALQPSLLMK